MCILLVRFTKVLLKEKTNMVTSLCLNTSFSKVRAKRGLILKEVEGKGCKKQKNLQIFFQVKNQWRKAWRGATKAFIVLHLERKQNIHVYPCVWKRNNPITNARRRNSHDQGSQKIHSRTMFGEEMKACNKTCTIT